jgi:hypothetical protein
MTKERRDRSDCEKSRAPQASTDGEALRRNPPAQAKIEARSRNDLRIGKLALVGDEVTLQILLRDEAACDQFFANIQDEIAKDAPSAVARRVRLDSDVY